MRLDPVLENNLPDKGNTILDVGCGKGELLGTLYNRGYRCLCGVDKDTGFNMARHRLGIIEKEAIEFLCADEYQYSCIICWDMLEHIKRSDVPRLLRAMCMRTTPHGVLILHLPNAEGLFGSRIMHSDLTHRWAYTPQLITALLNRAGFQDVQIHECRPIVHGPVSFLRYIAWSVISTIGRMVLAVETGQYNGIVSQNMLVVARKECVE